MKLEISTFPPGHSPDDFLATGPVATKDGEFDGVYLVDMGCFKQEKIDSNKIYHAACVQSKINQKWYTFFLWGRVGGSTQFQMEEFSSKDEAQHAFASQCHKKNDKRGIWRSIGGIKTLVPKSDKDDVYKVQKLQSRSYGLPNARNISAEAIDPSKIKAISANPSSAPSKPKNTSSIDSQTSALLRDLRVGTVSFTRSSLEGGNIPALSAITEARDVLDAALRRIGKVGDDINNQIRDNQLKQLTYEIYSRIPKKKNRNAAPETWMLNKDTANLWTQDLDAFENAIYANTEIEQPAESSFGDLPLQTMEWISPQSELGKFIYEWMPNASANRHYNVGQLKIKNVWKVERTGDSKLFTQALEKYRASGSYEKALFQPKTRPDLTREELKKYISSNVSLLFHGTRSVNVPGILRTMLSKRKNLGPGVVLTGLMFSTSAALAYFADDFRKSVGYTSDSGSYYGAGGGGISGRGAFIFLMDCALGTPFVAPRAHPYSGPPTGHHCIFGKAGVSGVQNNEWILF